MGEESAAPLRTVARYAQAWNVWGLPPTLARKGALLDDYCLQAGRDPADVVHTAAVFLAVTDDPATAAELRTGLGERAGLVGTPDDIRAAIAAYADAGVGELIIADYNHTPQSRAAALHRLRREVLGG